MNESDRIGLVLEGGGMRGLFTAGVLDALYAAGIRFDGIVGVSAGAAFGCNYKSHQPGRVLRYNLRFCRDRRYWGFGSLLRTGDLFNAEFCYRTLPRSLDPWDGAAFEADPTRFWAVATDVDTGEPVYPELTAADDRAVDWIQASSSMPLVSRPVEIDGRRYLDGGLSDSVPLAWFQSIGFARNVVVLTRPAPYRKRPSRTWALLHPFLRRLPAVEAALATRAERYNRTVEFVEAEEAKGAVFVIRPDAELPIGRVTRSRADIQAAYDLGRDAADRALEPLREWMRRPHPPERRAPVPPAPPPRKRAGRIALALYAVFLLYKTCHGAFVVFLIVSVVSLVLQLLNNALSDVIAWPKNAHLTLLFILLLNIPVAMGVSLCHRRWKRAIAQCLLSVTAFFVYAYLGFIVFCVPTRRTNPPSDAWIGSAVCHFTHIERTRLKYLGGISQREPVVVFQVLGKEPANEHFRLGSSRGEGDWGPKHFQSIMEFCHLPVSLPPDTIIYHCPCDGGSINLLRMGEESLLIYEGF